MVVLSCVTKQASEAAADEIERKLSHAHNQVEIAQISSLPLREYLHMHMRETKPN